MKKFRYTTIQSQGREAPIVFLAILSKDGGENGTDQVYVTLGQPMPSIQPPQKAGFKFRGYYYQNTKYYNADGSSASVWDIQQDAQLTALWTQLYIFTSGTPYLYVDKYNKSTYVLENSSEYNAHSSDISYYLDSDGDYVYAAWANGKVVKYDAISLEFVAEISIGGNTARCIAVDGTHVYVGGGNSSGTQGIVRKYTKDLSLVATGFYTEFDRVDNIILDDSSVYASGSEFNGFKKIFKFSKSTMDKVAETSASVTTAQMVIDGQHLYARGPGNYLARYNTSDMSLDASATVLTNSIGNIAVDETHVYIGNRVDSTITRFVKSTLAFDTSVTLVSAGSSPNALEIDSDNIYVGGNNELKSIRVVSKASLTQIAQLPVSPNNSTILDMFVEQ